MATEEKRNLLGIQKFKKREKLKQLTSYCAKFQKITLLEMVLKAFATSTCSTTQLKWMFRITQMPWTTTSHLPLITTPNWWNNKWMKNVSWKCKNKTLFTNRYRTSPTTISWMPPKGLAKAKSLVAPKTRTMGMGIWFITTWEHTWNNCGKVLVETSRSKRSCKCSKTIHEKPLIERCDDRMKVDLKESKVNSKFKLGWKSNKEP